MCASSLLLRTFREPSVRFLDAPSRYGRLKVLDLVHYEKSPIRNLAPHYVN
ncbi:hypothetical protein HOLleu_03106 [Holothuria leucospilota]|uniref:Uncharacterized protein n=1 Tax=Holothuria leucospilota TaxID=206669 RepID=A0A9Q1CQD8_HOLLE|nr:hypothetical protein HOLleu_03106 [Holothuria leucospilota]